MTKRSSFKKLVRERMKKTGESYSTARRHVIAADAAHGPSTHYPGINPASTALRILLATAGVENPVTGKPFSEAMLLGIAGGIGAGVFSFRYEKEDFSSFFAAGRHSWHDNLAFMQGCLQRLGVECRVWESTSAKKGWEQLREALEYGPVAAWVDMANLPYHGMPQSFSGGGYHLLVVQSLDEQREIAVVSDLMDEPLEVAFADLERARMRIRKDRQRLLAIAKTKGKADLDMAVREGISACVSGLTSARMKNFTLIAFEDWARQMHGSTGKQSWAAVFPRGRHLWTAMCWSHECIEYFFSGGGMLRPFFADFLEEAASQTARPALKELATQYRSIGRAWSELAGALLPADNETCRRARELFELRAESYNSMQDSGKQRERIWQQITELQDQTQAEFPLDETKVDEMLGNAKQNLLAICEAERNALEAMQEAVR